MLLLAVACGGGGDRPTPSRSPGGSSPTTSAGPSGAATDTAGAIGTPFVAPWPSGWDSGFCPIFAEMVVMQELAVDVGRALDDGARAEARALNTELGQAATSVRSALGELPPWEAAEPLEARIVALLDLADEMALRYGRHFENNRPAPRNAAREAGGRMNDVVPDLLDRLILLEEAGLACAGLDFSLEVPPRP